MVKKYCYNHVNLFSMQALGNIDCNICMLTISYSGIKFIYMFNKNKFWKDLLIKRSKIYKKKNYI